MTCTHPPARVISAPVVREFLRAVGVETCPRCYQVVRILGRKGTAWEKP